MRAFGASEEIIRSKLGWDKVDPLAPDGNGVVTIGVWDNLMDAVSVFQHSQPQMLAGLSGLVWLGVSSVEIKAALNNLRIRPKSKWPEITKDVQFMGSIAARLNNQSKGSK